MSVYYSANLSVQEVVKHVPVSINFPQCSYMELHT